MPRRSIVALKHRILRYLLAVLISSLIAVIGIVVFRAWSADESHITIQVLPITDDEALQVQVAGAVIEPGVFTLPEGSSVSDAVAHAGGLTPDADLDQETASATVTDGEFVLIPAGNLDSNAPAGPIDINAASAAEFESLPGIGPVIAQRIVQYREIHDGFQSLDELANVTGISDRMVDEMRSQIVLGSR